MRVVLSNGDVLPATQQKTFTTPRGVAITQRGRIVVADGAATAREVSYAEPQITNITPTVLSNKGGDRVTVTGSNFAPETQVVGDGGPGAQAEIFAPRGVAIDDSGNLYIADSNNVVRRVDAGTLVITTVAGTKGQPGFSGDNGLATAAGLGFPHGLSLDASGNLYIADAYNHRIRAVRRASTSSSSHH